MNAIEKLRLITVPIEKSGDPETLSEQVKFRFSGNKAAFYWAEESFTFFFKAPLGDSFFQVVYCKIGFENGRKNISIFPKLNKFTYFSSLALFFIAIILLVLGFVFQNGIFLGVPALFPFVAAAGYFINRQHKKEAKWFLEDLLKIEEINTPDTKKV